MKKSPPSPKVLAAGHGSPGRLNEAALDAPEAGLPMTGQKVRQAIFHEDVPRLLQPPAERGNQLRNRRS